jgi:hypothetical protein
VSHSTAFLHEACPSLRGPAWQLSRKRRQHTLQANMPNPAEFQATADVLLQLQCGLQLPVHSMLLASTSPVLCNMLKMAASLVEVGSKALLPLHDVTEEEALDILKARPVDTPSRSPANGLNAPCAP